MSKVRQEKAFTPVTVTLETQQEVDVLRELTGSIIGGGPVRAITNQLYKQLGEFASPESPIYFDRSTALRIH